MFHAWDVPVILGATVEDFKPVGPIPLVEDVAVDRLDEMAVH